MKKFITQLDYKMGKWYVPFVLVILTLILFVIGYSYVQPVDTKITLNSIATRTIRATKTVEDTDATQKAREVAAQNVANVYEQDETIATQKVAEIETFLTIIGNYRTDLANMTDTPTNIYQKRTELISNFFASLDKENSSIKSYAIVFSDSLLQKLLTVTETEFAKISTMTKSIVGDTLKEKIYSSESDLSKVKESAYQTIVAMTYSDTIRETTKELVNAAIVSNMVINEEATEAAKAKASEQVSAVMIAQGEVVVREGEVIGTTAYKKLQLLNMTGSDWAYNLVGGYVLVLVIQFILVWYVITQFGISMTRQVLYVNIYTSVMIALSVVLVIVTQMQNAGLEYIGLVAPIGLITYFLINKAHRRLAILAVTFINIIYFFISNSGNVEQIGLVWKFYVIIGLLSTILLSKRKQRRLIENFIIFSAIYISVITSLAALHNIALLSNTFGMMVLYSVINVFLTIGTWSLGRPYFDLLFEDKAVLRLVELSNPNHPLLKELISKAPGTYHHSIMVANLSANAVELIGGDSLFTRVACYYHDVGKLKNPMFFVENLPSGMENPHNLLTPFESKQIIIDHVKYGVEKLKEYNMPKSIIDICLEHHGTTVVKYFYVQAKNMDDTVQMDDFRYPGPTPRTKESMVISIADTAEAATRSMKTPTREAITNLVEQTIQSRILDGQCNHCPITMKELNIVKQSIIDGLVGSYHMRVEYPTLQTKRKKRSKKYEE